MMMLMKVVDALLEVVVVQEDVEVVEMKKIQKGDLLMELEVVIKNFLSYFVKDNYLQKR